MTMTSVWNMNDQYSNYSLKKIHHSITRSHRIYIHARALILIIHATSWICYDHSNCSDCKRSVKSVERSTPCHLRSEKKGFVSKRHVPKESSTIFAVYMIYIYVWVHHRQLDREVRTERTNTAQRRRREQRRQRKGAKKRKTDIVMWLLVVRVEIQNERGS